MKRKRTIWLILMFCWWGLLFPELTFTEDSLRVVYTRELDAEILCEKEDDEQSQWETYVNFLQAGPEQVKVKSKLLELLKGLWK